MSDNESFRQYLFEEFQEEESMFSLSEVIFIERREFNRAKALKAYNEEHQTVLSEIKGDSRIEKYKMTKLKEFWEETYKVYGKDILQRKGILCQISMKL